jgi:predicted nuclease of predicted toxin-antitoxin system
VPDHRVPIYLDECIEIKVAVGLRDCGFEAVHVTEIGRRGKDDPEQLEYAAEHGMTFLTYNIGHFVEIHGEWTVVGKQHCGILMAESYTYQRSVGGLIAAVRSTLRHYGDLYEGTQNWIHNNIFYVRNF